MLKWNPIPNGPIQVDWRPVFDGVIHVGAIQPFQLEDLWDDKNPKIKSIKDNIEAIIAKCNPKEINEHSWSGSMAPDHWHLDCNGVRDENAVFITSLTLDPLAKAGTLFRNAQGDIFQAEVWHLYLVRYRLEHKGVLGFPKIFLRYYTSLPFEV